MVWDIKLIFDDAKAYVILRRRTKPDLDSWYIAGWANKALTELEVMNDGSMNDNTIPWDQNDEHSDKNKVHRNQRIPTNILGRNIHHFYIWSGGQTQKDAYISRYSPY